MSDKDFSEIIKGLNFYNQNKTWSQRVSSWFQKEGDQNQSEDIEQNKENENISLLSKFSNWSSQKVESAKQVGSFALDAGERMKYFVIFLAVAGVCFFGSFMFLPIILLAPSKFAMLFTLGSIAIHLAIAFTYGNPLDYVQNIFSKTKNMGFACLYIISVLGTLYAALISKSYILVIIFSSAQFSCVLWFLCGFIPGGTFGLKRAVGCIISGCKKFLKI